ncbi:unnamed protein product [Eruca vesicaria subsp. sativa]|uniref:Protein BIG GRAIN 1-like B n=1 Tax=Eruca vesicaria subsp. sativa TaxID=29727 RepID=A0ABC8IZA3_ERUVS|nr:unnamed protein product [Eruca vesicaria subsp. sativa]
METWEKPRVSSSRDHHYRQPSFSSTLLDQIYRSIDDSPPLESTRKKKQPHSLHQEHAPIFHRRSIAADFERSRRTTTSSVFLTYSNSTSSDSSGFSSSESDSFYLRTNPPPHTRQPNPIRTNTLIEKPSSKQEHGSFLRTKSKALKIYTDLKKVKQPLSPGGRLATFLNSLFTNAASNHKKLKKINTTVTSSAEPPPPQSSSNTTCSSTSSFSRSCLSKTPSSSGKSKRSVRFCPVNVILDEDSSIHIPYGYSSNKLHGKNVDRHVMEEENRRVIEAAKDLIRTYQKNKTCDNVQEEEDDEDDDAASYASSDLFELENLAAVGIERYREELPVYETTRLDNTNRAIATSLVV